MPPVHHELRRLGVDVVQLPVNANSTSGFSPLMMRAMLLPGSQRGAGAGLLRC
jgi:hypothetical protein